MPFVNVKLTRPEPTYEQKKAIAEGITQLLADVLGKDPARTHVVIEDIDTDNWAVGGQLVTDYRRTQASS